MRNKRTVIFLCFLLSIVVTSCAPKIVQPVIETSTKEASLFELQKTLDSLNSHFPTNYYGKASANYTDNNNNQSFKASVRMKTDTAITALLTYAGIPIINSILTKDLINFQNKRSKCYMEQDLADLKNTFNFSFGFQDIVSLILGLPMGYNNNNSYYLLSNEDYHIVASHGVPSQTGESKLLPQEIIYRYYLSKIDNTLEKVELEAPKEQLKAIVNFKNREINTEYHLPQSIAVQIISNSNEINLTLDFTKIDVIQEQEINYTVPDNYEHCQ